MRIFVSATNTLGLFGPLALGFHVASEWDADLPSYMMHAYYAKLTHAPQKSFIEIPEGTHTVIVEKNRMQLFEAVQAFLDK